MAAVTVATGWPITNVAGKLRQVLYKLTVVTTGDTLTLNSLNHVVGVSVSPNSGITGLSATDRSGATAAYLTFTGTGASIFVTIWGT
jgi:hypothetical protein